MGSYRPSSYIIAKWMVALIAITATVIIAQFSRVTSMITPANSNAAMIIVNRRRDHEFVIIAPVLYYYPHTPTCHNFSRTHNSNTAFKSKYITFKQNLFTLCLKQK